MAKKMKVKKQRGEMGSYSDSPGRDDKIAYGNSADRALQKLRSSTDKTPSIVGRGYGLASKKKGEQ